VATVTNINDVLDGHVSLDLDCVDRVYLNAYVPTLQVGGQVNRFLHEHLGQPVASPAVVERIGNRFRREVKAFADDNGIPVLRLAKPDRTRWDDRKIDHVRPNATAARLRHVLPTLGARPMAAVRTTEVRALVTGLSKTLAPSTVEAVYRLVATIFRAAVDDRVIASTPCRNVTLPRPDGAQVVPLSVEEVGRLVEAMPSHYRAGLVAAAGLGLRQGELFGLTVDRVDWLRRTVRVDRQLLTAPGALPAFGPTKTEASVRTLPAPTVVLEALTAHRLDRGEGPDGLIFFTSHGTAIRRGLAAATWRAAADRAGLPDSSGWQAARHFYASMLIAGGESVKVVQKRLGHKSAMETLDTYGHLWPDSDESTRVTVDRLLGPALGAAMGGKAEVGEPNLAPMTRPSPSG